MFLRRLTWIFGGLFVVFGLAILLTESVHWQRVWAGMSTLSLAGFAFALAGDALGYWRFLATWCRPTTSRLLARSRIQRRLAGILLTVKSRHASSTLTVHVAETTRS